jgi:hypothetical protein
VQGVQNGLVQFGFRGVRAGEIAGNITVENVRWLMQYLGRINDEQIRGALVASGATPAETVCFVSAVRDRIEQLRRVAGGSAPIAPLSRSQSAQP